MAGAGGGLERHGRRFRINALWRAAFGNWFKLEPLSLLVRKDAGPRRFLSISGASAAWRTIRWPPTAATFAAFMLGWGVEPWQA